MQAAEDAGIKLYPAQFSGVMVADSVDDGQLVEMVKALGIQVTDDGDAPHTA